MHKIKLRDYQQKVVDDLYLNHSTNQYRNLVVAPTGCGKSLIIAQLCLDAIEKGKKTLIIVHRRKLMDQLKETIERYSQYRVGEIVAGKKLDYRNYFVLVAMAQTLSNRLLPPDISHVVLDECHLTCYLAIMEKIMEKYCGGIWALSGTKITGLTATPWRLKKKEGFCRYFTRQVKAPTVRELIDLGYLTTPRTFCYDMEGLDELLTNSDGEYTLASLTKVCGEAYNSDIVEKYTTSFGKRKAIAFCATVEGAKNLAFQLTQSGLLSKHVDGSMDDLERNRLYSEFKEGKIRVLVSILTLCEGYDETSIEAVILARPTKSPALLTQQIGRGLRLHEGKEYVDIIDFGSNFSKLTKVQGKTITDHISIDYSRLCPPSSSNTLVAPTKTCPQCGTEEIRVFARFCDECGHEFKGKLTPKPETITFPELIPYINPEMFVRYQWLRKYVAKKFEQKASPLQIFAEYNHRFGTLPPNDFFLGALFNLEATPVNLRAYKNYMKDCKIDVKTGMKFFSLEFGQPGRVYWINCTEYKIPEELANTILEFQK